MLFGFYPRDSFFDLSPWGQVGLLVISAGLAALTLVATWILLRRNSPIVRVSGALLSFWLFVWISPQVYYAYYRVIIPDLPLQWVIWPPPAPLHALEMLAFQGPHTLSQHSQGLLGWILIVTQLLCRLTGRSNPKDSGHRGGDLG